MGLRELTMDEVKVTLRKEWEDQPVRGAFDTGDADRDRKMEDEIILRRTEGDAWAWCTVFAEATWGGFHGQATLGCCSYEDEADFRGKGGYWEDLQRDALSDLNEQVAGVYAQVEPLVEYRGAEVTR